ncbi:restriction endonuclease subunit S [Stutzerimonas xanthomarina]|nr:restriction endonuclease subunit S [Stutzerimonas xanthomarina]
MRSEWTSYKIGEIFELVNGYAFKSGDFISSGIPVLKIKNVKPNNVVLDDLSYVSVEVASRRNDKAIRRGDILITMSGNRFDGSKDTWVGKVAYFDISGHYMLNQRVGVLRPREGVVIDRKCAAYFLSSDDYQKLFISIATSSGGQANLSPAQILGEQLHLPPIEEQARISELLGGLDDRITLLRETNATLEAIAQALFKSWFVDFDPVRAKAEGRQPEGMDATTAALFPDSFEESELGLVPKGWGIGCVGDLASQKKGSVNPLASPGVLYEHYSLPAFDSGQAPVFELGKEIKSNKTPLPEEAVLLSKLNPHIPRVWLPVSHGVNAVCSTEFLAYSPQGGASKELIYCLFGSDTFQQQLCQLVTGTSNSHQRVKPDRVLAVKLPIADKPALRAFTEIVRPLFDRVHAGRLQAQTLTQLRDTLLPRLISGQLRVPDAECTVEDALA